MKRAFTFVAAVIWSCCMCAETKDVTIYFYKADVLLNVTDGLDAIDEVKQEDVPGRKFMKNGQLFIERDGKTYNALGVVVTPRG